MLCCVTAVFACARVWSVPFATRRGGGVGGVGGVAGVALPVLVARDMAPLSLPAGRRACVSERHGHRMSVSVDDIGGRSR